MTTNAVERSRFRFKMTRRIHRSHQMCHTETLQKSDAHAGHCCTNRDEIFLLIKNRLFCPFWKTRVNLLEVNFISLKTIFNPFMFIFVSFGVQIFLYKFERCIKGTLGNTKISWKIVAHWGHSLCDIGYNRCIWYVGYGVIFI